MNMGVLLQLFAFLFLVILTSAQDSQIGGECTYDKDCAATFAFCENQRSCSCMIGYREIVTDDLPNQCAPNLGFPCKRDNECSSIESAQCRRDMCVCGSGYVAHSNTKECLRESSGFRSPCLEDIQCNSLLGDDSTCFMEKCICKEGFHDYDNKCIQTKALGEACNFTKDCFINDEQRDLIECSPKTNKCSCKSNAHVYENSCKASAHHMVVSVAGLLLGFVLVRTFA